MPDHIVLEMHEQADSPYEAREAQLDAGLHQEIDQRMLVRRREQIDCDILLRVLREQHGHRKATAEALGISERTLYRHMKKLRERTWHQS
jgi:transcriptional regulator with PAS, ATPase and Fis domain